MPLQRAIQHREKLAALISRGVGIIEIQKTLGLSYAAIRDMIRLLGLPKPVDHRTQRGTATSSARPRDLTRARAVSKTRYVSRTYARAVLDGASAPRKPSNYAGSQRQVSERFSVQAPSRYLPLVRRQRDAN
jgi:hypothetical protein